MFAWMFPRYGSVSNKKWKRGTSGCQSYENTLGRWPLWDEVLQECLGQLKTDGDKKQKKEVWCKTKTLHLMCDWQNEEVADIEKYSQMLEKADQKERKDVLIMTA